MPSKQELSDQLAITQKITAAVDMMAKSMEKIDASYDTQIAAVKKLAEAIEALKGFDFSQINGVKLDRFQGAMQDSEKTVSTLTGRIKDLGVQVGKKMTPQMAAGVGAISGLEQGFKNVIALSKGFGGFLTKAVSWVGNLAASIISIPFQIFDKLVSAAAGASGGANELAQAIENLRKEMGDLKGPGSAAVLETTKSLKGFSDTGLSAWRVFGTLAERLEFVTKDAVAMGATFGVLRKEFEQNGGALLAFQKGLGVSEEGMKAVGDRAISIGKPMTKVFMDMTKQTLALGDAFNLDQQLIGKDMAKALVDVHHFGALTVKEIGQASVYARKLGLELDKITGTLDQFETFDSAAESAAKLSQAFGVQVDAFKLMEAQNPADQIDMLRKSFKSAGVDASNFTRQQAKLLSTSTGLDEATVRQAFSAKNYGVSLNDVKKKSEAAEKKTMTQAEAMSKLADSIERMVKSGSAMEGGFWKMFLKGISTGLQSSQEFVKVMQNIRLALMSVFQIGIQLGRVLPKIFPGMQELLAGLADIFDPKKFATLFTGISQEISKLVSGKQSLPEMMKNLQKKFFDFFDSEKPAGKKLLEGFKKMFKFIAKTFAEGVKWASDEIAEGLGVIIGYLSGDKKPPGTGEISKNVNFFAKALKPLGEALLHAWTVLAPKIGELLMMLAHKFKEFLMSPRVLKIIAPAIPALLSTLFGPVILRSVLATVTRSLAKSVFGMIGKALTGPAAGEEAEGIAKGVGGVLGKSFSSIGKFLGPVAIVAAIADAAVNVKDAMDKFQKDLAPKFGETEAKVGAASAGIINSLTFGLLPEDLQRQLATAVADIAHKLFTAVEDYFGSAFSTKLKDYISSELDVFSSLGELIKSIFSGDEDKISDAFLNLGDKIFVAAGKLGDFLNEAIPVLVVKFIEFAEKFAEKFTKTLSKTLSKLGDKIPIFGGILKGAALVLDTMSSFYSGMYTVFKKISNFFKEDGVMGSIGKLLAGVWQGVKAGFQSVADFFSSTLSSIGKFFSDAWDGIKSVWNAVGDWFTNTVITPLSNMFSKIEDFIKSTFTNAWNGVVITWNVISTWFDTNVSAPIKKIFEDGIFNTIKKAFDDAWDSAAKIFSIDNVTNLFGQVVTAITTKLDELTKIPVFKEMIAIAKKVFKIESPSKVFMDIGDDIVAGMDQSLQGLTDSMKTRMSDAAKAAADSSPNLTNQVQKAAVVTAPPVMKMEDLGALVEQTKTFNDAANSLNEYAKAMTSVSDSIKTGGVAQALKAVAEMVKQTQALDDALNKLPNMDVTAKLTRVAKAAGLGAKAVYTVQSKEVVINLNLNVTMDAGELEKVVILRKNSIVRDRINIALDKNEAAKLPENPNSPVQVPGPQHAP